MKMVPFEENELAMRLLRQGKALAVEMIPDDRDSASEIDHYKRMLGFSESSMSHFYCTILSEIGNMPNHYVVVGHHGEIVCGLHGDIFYVDEDEIEDFEFV